MRISAAVPALAVVLASSCAWAEAPSPVDRGFAAKASISNTFEIRQSRLALRRSSDPAVRAMARWMIKDHTAAQRSLDRAAMMTGTESGPMLDDEHEAKITALDTLSGSAFDDAYVSDQRAAHQATEQELRDFTASGEDPALLGWASRILPAVDLHLQHFRVMSAPAAP